MKRLAWLLLAVFCAALVQIQPARALPGKAKACGCCHGPGACGLPDCCPSATGAAVALDSEPSEQLVSVTIKALPATRAELAQFYTMLLEAAAQRPVFPATEPAAAARVPLFKAHCSFLI